MTRFPYRAALLACALMTPALYAQGFVHRQGGDILDIEFTDADHGLRCGDGGRVDWTSNGGDTWQPASVPDAVRGNLRGITYVPGTLPQQEVFVVGGQGVVLYSSNGGQDFAVYGTRVDDFGVPATLEDAYFFDATDGWVVGFGGVVQHTTDSGATWTQLPPPCHHYDAYQIEFIGNGVGLIASEQGIVLRTADNGANWNCIPIDSATLCPPLPNLSSPNCGGNVEFWGMDFADATHGYLAAGVGHNWGYLFRTADAGLTWSQEACFSLTPEDPNPCVGCGSCVCPHTPNTECAYLPTFYGMAATGPDSAIAVGYASTVLKRTQLNSFPGSPSCATCPTGTFGWLQTNPGSTTGLPPLNAATTAGGRVFYAGTFHITRRSDDGGTTFTDQGTTEYLRVEDGVFADANTGYMVGQSLVVLRTGDGGATLERAFDPGPCFGCRVLRGVAVSATGAVVAVGDNGTTVRSATGDPGTFTLVQATTNQRIHDVAFTPSGAWALAVGQAGTVMASADAGQTWLVHPASGIPANVDLFAVATLDESIAVAVGGRSGGGRAAYFTTDAGFTWAPLTFSGGTTGIQLRDVAIRGTQVVAVGGQNEVYEWLNGALTFQDPGGVAPPAFVVSVAFASDNDLFVGADNGSVLRRNFGTWSAPKSGTTWPVVSLSFPQSGLGFAFGRRSGLLAWQ